MNNKQYTVLLVYSSSYAIKANLILTKEGISSKMLPIPRHISSSCGVCLRISTGDKSRVLEVLKDKGLPLDGVFEIS